MADTVGYTKPSHYRQLVRDSIRLASNCIELGVHCHNDLGMATANTIMAIEEGITWPTVTVNGIGERAGNASLLEVAMATYGPLKMKSDVKLDALPELSFFIEKITGFIIPPNQPIVGQNAFRHESGIHVDGLLKSPSNYEAIDPSLFGFQRELVIGRQSGRAHIKAILESKGIDYSNHHVDQILEQIKENCERADPFVVSTIHHKLKKLVRKNNVLTSSQLNVIINSVMNRCSVT